MTIYFLLNLFKTIPTLCTISVDFLLAISLPKALPLTVKADTKALKTNWILNGKFIWVEIFIEINALIEPLKTPHMSPITSAHIFATLGAFFINFIESFDPFTFLVAFAWNSSSFATVTATPVSYTHLHLVLLKNQLKYMIYNFLLQIFLLYNFCQHVLHLSLIHI